MNCHDVKERLDDYVDGALSSGQREIVADHLRECASCRGELQRMQSLTRRIAELPLESAPSRDLWPGISERLKAPRTRDRWPWPRRPRAADRSPVHAEHPDSRGARTWRRRLVLGAALLCVLAGTFWLAVRANRASWTVAALQGVPFVDSDSLNHRGHLRVGEWLETDAASRARIDIGMIGEVEVDPNTRVRLLQAALTDHRIAVTRGTIHATIWAPPRLFFVETPSATAIDLGCAYTLVVADDGSSFLRVSVGWVALELAGKESVIPAGAVCETRPGSGPGTPYFEDAPAVLRESLRRHDAGEGGGEMVDEILRQARPRDALTLWHLLRETENPRRERIYDRLAGLAPPPKGVTREGILLGDRDMLDEWSDELGFGGWRFF